MLRRLERSAPQTKPTWTAMVNHAAALPESSHCARTYGMIAVAANHVDMDRTSVSASSVSACHRPSMNAMKDLLHKLLLSRRVAEERSSEGEWAKCPRSTLLSQEELDSSCESVG